MSTAPGQDPAQIRFRELEKRIWARVQVAKTLGQQTVSGVLKIASETPGADLEAVIDQAIEEFYE